MPGNTLAFGTMPIPTGVKCLFDIAAVVTLVDMIAQSVGAAVFDGPHDFMLFFSHFVAGAIGIAVLVKNVGDFIGRSVMVRCRQAHQ